MLGYARMLRLVGQLIQPRFHSAEEFWQDDRVLHKWKAAVEMFEFGSGGKPAKNVKLSAVPATKLAQLVSHSLLVHSDSLLRNAWRVKVMCSPSWVLWCCYAWYSLQKCLRFATQHKSPTTAPTLLLMRCLWQRHAWIRVDEFPQNSSGCHCCASGLELAWANWQATKFQVFSQVSNSQGWNWFCTCRTRGCTKATPLNVHAYMQTTYLHMTENQKSCILFI